MLPVGLVQVMLSNIFSVLMFTALALVVAADKILPALGLPVPAYYTTNIATNKAGYCMGIW